MYDFRSSMMVALESGVRFSTDSVARKRRMRVLYEPMKVVDGPMEGRSLKHLQSRPEIGFN